MADHREPPSTAPSQTFSVARRQIQAPRRSGALAAPSFSEQSTNEAMPVNRAAQSSPFGPPTQRSYRHWTSEEDASLFAAVKQYGKDWTLVKAVVEQDGFTPRPRPCFPARWRTLEERAARQKWDVQRTTEAAADASTSSSTSAGDAGGSLGGDVGEKEGEGEQGRDDSASAYEVAGQTRSSSATLPVAKPKRGRGRPRKHPLPAQAITSSSSHANPADTDLNGTPTASRDPQASRSTRALDTPTPSSPQGAERGRASAAGVALAAGACANMSSSEAPVWSLNNRPLTYSTDLQPNGCLITDLPPGFQVYIVTPTRCQVVVPAQIPPHESLHQTEAQQQCNALTEAPFAFEVEKDRSIKALNLPEGTNHSREVVEAENGEVRTQEGYHGPGGYTVLFDYRCEVGGGSSDEGSEGSAGERGE